MKFDWESLRPYVAFILGIALLLGLYPIDIANPLVNECDR